MLFVLLFFAMFYILLLFNLKIIVTLFSYFSLSFSYFPYLFSYFSLSFSSFFGAIGRISRVFANGLGEQGSIPGQVIPKTQKMVLDAALFNTQHYKVQIKGSGAIKGIVQHPPLHFGVVATEKGTFGSSSTKVANFTYYHIFCLCLFLSLNFPSTPFFCFFFILFTSFHLLTSYLLCVKYSFLLSFFLSFFLVTISCNLLFFSHSIKGYLPIPIKIITAPLTFNE